MSDWDAPPTEIELAAAGWAAPPSKAELAAAAPRVGASETLVERAGQAFPFMAPVTDLLSTGIAQSLPSRQPGVEFTPEALAEMQARGMASPRELPGSPLSRALEQYRGIRDTRRERTKAGSEQNPVASKLGTGIGVVTAALTPLPKFLPKSATLGSKMVAGGKTAAAYGGAQGLTEGEADLTRGEIGQALAETGVGAGLGGLIGAGAAGAAEVIKPLAKSVQNFAVDQARKFLLSGADQLSTRKAVPASAVMAALETPGAVTPFGSATSAQEALSEAAGLAGKDLGRVRKALETEGVTGPNAIALADQLRAKGDELMLTEANKAIPRMYFRAADRIKEMAIAGEERGGPLGRLGLEQAEKAKSSYQKLAEPAYERLKGPEAAKVNADIARRVRLANEIAVADAARKAGPGSAVADLNKEFIPAKRQFGNLAKAMAASQRGAARESQRQGGGLLQTAAKLGAVGMAGGAGAVAGELGMGAAKRFGTGAAASGAHRLADVLRSGSMAPGLAQGGIQLTQDEMQRLTDYLMGGK